MKPARIAAVMEKEVREIARDPVTVGIALIMPLIMLFLFGYAISLDVRHIRMGVLDHDRSPASRQLADRFVQSGYFRLNGAYGTPQEIERALQRNKVKLALVIPPGFQQRLARGDAAPVQVLIDGTYTAVAGLVAAYAESIISGFPQEAAPAAQVEVRVWYNPALRSANFIVPGLFGVILMAFPPLLTALAITREKESGSIQQVYASPLTPAEFLAGKLVPYGVIAFLQIVMVVIAGFVWFGVPMRGSLGLVLATGLVYVFVTVGIGLLVSTITHSQIVAILLTLIIALMPSMLFSGFLFPIFTMPYIAQLYARTLPAGYFVDFARAVVLKGVGLPELWPTIALLSAYSLIIFILAVRLFRKKVA
jgi:ABC-2 type transport system permease protein